MLVLRLINNGEIILIMAVAPLGHPFAAMWIRCRKRLGQIFNCAIDGLAIAVNPRLDISGLTVQQVVDIYTGKVTNWQQVGGPNLTITPFSRRPEDGGTVEYFIQEVLGKQPLGGNVVMVRDTTDGLWRVAATLGGHLLCLCPRGGGSVQHPPASPRSSAQSIRPSLSRTLRSPRTLPPRA